ncbi:protein LATERAL ROOT PRIMORDIUM 1 [Lycium barbarum]|uniref:protein LATERAL ROOT PRIMORDIUM 1 n=1 Tax=Lycium barbarum TaxID=112863 RepID=UPI00293F272B|nr:protein LATERAL ROOT PRIMORDIUM 1 [Lycium barbarum]XP_060216126.1 protein LATERAL ROOT PRIMORDIUM 1 [Lycium barbarum]XP_060216127.1 protein LATERAL ROOT PRIMORDIUM 1 [Lycium barbarum]
MWSASSSRQMQINYGLHQPEMGMFVVHPASLHHHHHHHQNENTINFDPHHHHNHQSINTSGTNTSLGVGVIPLLTATPLTNNMVSFDDQDLVSRNRGGNNDGSGFQFFSSNQVQQQNSTNYTKNSSNILGGGNNIGSGNNIGGSVSSTSSTTTCQDCGNQAKKDCTHRRCRTCCKSRGFDCTTHLKSTWVPAARRRERQLMSGATNVNVAAGSSSQSTSSAKKPRLSQTTTTASHTSTSNNNTPPRSFDTSSSHQDASFKASLPGQVRAPAVFKCVRVTSVDEGDDEFAYQAVVRIGGHVFKGFLYDQGLDEGKDNNNNNNNFPNLSDLHLGGGNANETSVLYAASTGGGGLLGGSNYGNQIN